MNECRACAVYYPTVLARISEPYYRELATWAAGRCNDCFVALAPALDAATRQREAAGQGAAA